MKINVNGGELPEEEVNAYVKHVEDQYPDKNIDTLDIGVPVLSMHAPFELISKYDLYSAHKAFSAFCKD